jgi:hypothetical protein
MRYHSESTVVRLSTEKNHFGTPEKNTEKKHVDKTLVAMSSFECDGGRLSVCALRCKSVILCIKVAVRAVHQQNTHAYKTS